MTSTLVFWWAPSGGDVWVNASCCSQCTKEWEGLHEGEGPAQLLRHSKYKNCLWYRHKEVELSERDVSRVQAWLRKRLSEGTSEDGATLSLGVWKRKRSLGKRKQPETHTKTHTLWHTDSKAGSNTCFTSAPERKAGCLQWRSGEKQRRHDMLIVPGLKDGFGKGTGSLSSSIMREFNGPVSGFAIIPFVDSAGQQLLWKRRHVYLILFLLKKTFSLQIVGCLGLRTGGGEDTLPWISVSRDGSFTMR